MVHASRLASFALLLAAALSSPPASAFGERDPNYGPVVKANGFCTGSLLAFDDGGIVVGFSGWEQGSAGLAKLRPDGSPDLAWGQDGRVMGVSSPFVRTPDGGLLVSRVTVEGHRLLRLSRDGRVDRTYGTEGNSDVLPPVTEAVLQPDGALVAQVTNAGYLGFARLDPRGRLDPTFGSGGLVALPIAANGLDRIYAWGVERGGLVQVGYHPANRPERPALRRFPVAFDAPNGAAPDGRLVPRDVIASWLAPRAKVQPDGTLLIADACNGPGACGSGVAAIARFDANGNTDLGFGQDGRAIVDILGPRGPSSFQAPVALLAGERGRHTLLIRFLQHTGGTFSFHPTGLAAVRLMADGSLDPAFPNGQRMSEEHGGYAAWAQLDDGRLIVWEARRNGPDGPPTDRCSVVRLAADSPRAEAVLVEYRRPDVDHYFITAEGAETHALDNLPIGLGWERTGQTFGAWLDRDLPDATPVCRFYGDTQAGPASHFFIPEGRDCDGLKSIGDSTPPGQKAWRYEGRTFRVREAFGGGCVANLSPVYRLYNDGFAKGADSNHRYVTDTALFGPMRARGWIVEGIAFCVPPASRSSGS